MPNADRMSSRPPRERGAALIVGLVLLTVMTVLAVSTMSTASLELLMAGNTQYKQNAFQLAESALERTWRDYRRGLNAIAAGGETENFFVLVDSPGTPLTEEVTGKDDKDDTYGVNVSSLGSTEPLRCRSSVGNFREYHVQAEARAETDVRNARSRQRRGFAMCFVRPAAF